MLRKKYGRHYSWKTKARLFPRFCNTFVGFDNKEKWRIAQICYGLKNTRIRPVGGSHDSRIGRIRDNFKPKGIKLCPLPYRWVGFPFRPKRTCSRQRAKGKGCSNTRWYICLLMTRLDSTTVFHYHKLMSERVYSFGIGWELERHGLSCFSTNVV